MREMEPTPPYRCLATLLLVFLTACGGGGGGGGGTTDVAGGGIGGTGISTGPITATGTVAAASVGGAVVTAAVTMASTIPTITVNGAVFKIPATATVALNGRQKSATDLRVGQVVTVRFTGDPGTATADAVTYDPNLTAPVEAVDPVNGTITLLGQVVRVENLLAAQDDAGQVITPTTILSDIKPGDLLEISGERDADGLLHATRIERKVQDTDPNAPVSVEVEGVVDRLVEGESFTLDTLTVVIPQGLTVDGTLADGVEVDVEGTLSGTTLTAGSIEVKGSPVADQVQNSQVELKGFITTIDHLMSHDEIEVDGVVVQLSGATEIKGDEGMMAGRADLHLNVEVEVKGTADGSGGVVAERITLDG